MVDSPAVTVTSPPAPSTALPAEILTFPPTPLLPPNCSSPRPSPASNLMSPPDPPSLVIPEPAVIATSPPTPLK